MSKFMILYRAPVSAREQLASATPEQQQAGMEAWRVWAEKVGYAIADLGAPLAHTAHVGPGTAGTDEVTGYSLLNAGSADEVQTLLEGHPHFMMPGGSIEVLELIPIAGM
jgi:hypothetical protein